MMSLACVYEQDYESADDYLARAIEADSSVPYYYLMQGVCQYWKCIPEDLRISNELFPVLYEQRMLYLKISEKEFIKKATTCYKKAYDMDKYVNNHSLQITILGVWLNTLSIDASYNKEAQSIVNELRELDSYNILYNINGTEPLLTHAVKELVKMFLPKRKNHKRYLLCKRFYTVW